jgi:hypothetical protein
VLQFVFCNGQPIAENQLPTHCRVTSAAGGWGGICCSLRSLLLVAWPLHRIYNLCRFICPFSPPIFTVVVKLFLQCWGSFPHFRTMWNKRKGVKSLFCLHAFGNVHPAINRHYIHVIVYGYMFL